MRYPTVTGHRREQMTKDLEQILTSAFSLLPEEKANGARRNLLKRFGSGEAHFVEDLKWAEFDLKGRFLRGGASDISGYATRIVSNSQEDPDIHHIVRFAAENGHRAGHAAWIADRKRLYWFVPFTPTRVDGFPQRRLRCIAIDQSVFDEIVRVFNADSGLSGAETRVMYQTIAGLSLRDAASLDALAYETKRSHIKSACEKLHCSGQKELVRLVMGQMTHLMSVSGSQAAGAEIAEGFVSRYLADDVRLTVQRLSNGRLIRVLECGPASGRPVLMIHGLMFPMMLFGLSGRLVSLGIRLIVPLRPGYFEERSIAGLYEHADFIRTGLDDIADYLRQCAYGPIPVIGNSIGGVIAMRFAALYPDLVSRLIALSMNLMRTTSEDKPYAAEFRKAMRALTDRPDIFRLVNWEFRRHYARQETCREILLNLFGKSRTDCDVLEGAITDVPAYALFSETYQHSLIGIAEDFGFVMNAWQSVVASLPVPVTLIHGIEDPLTRIDALEDAARRTPDIELVGIEGGGHFIAISHAPAVWSRIGTVAGA